MKKKKKKQKNKIKAVKTYEPKYKKNGKRKEQWKPIKEWKGFYEISDLGRVKSLDHVVERFSISGNLCFCHYKGRVLKLVIRRDGYRKVTLSRSGKRKDYNVHRLTFRAFHGKITAEHIMHLDGDSGNNKAENLRQGSASCNDAFKIDHGTQARGERQGRSKLTKKDVIEIRAFVVAGELTHAAIAEIYGISRGTVSNIASRRTWKHVK